MNFDIIVCLTGFIDAGDDAPSQKKPHMCQCVCYYAGTLKPSSAPSVRVLKTNQHVEISQPQFLHKVAESSFCPSIMNNNIAAQNQMRESSHRTAAMLTPKQN